MKKVLSIFLSLAMAMSLMAAPASAYFNDTVNHSNADAIEVLNTLGIVNGYSEDEKTMVTTFSDNGFLMV